MPARPIARGPVIPVNPRVALRPDEAAQVLQHPDVARAVERMLNERSAPKPTEPATPATDR